MPVDSALLGLLGELKALTRIQKGESALSLQYIANFPIKSESTYYQVDAIVVCTKGIFCLEVKNWSCIVTCSPSAYWTVKYPTEEIKVRSPISQNTGHRDRIERMLGYNVASYVLFSGSTTLINNPDNVLNTSAFIPLLKTLPDQLSSQKIQGIVDKLTAYKRAIEPEMLVDFVFKQVSSKKLNEVKI